MAIEAELKARVRNPAHVRALLGDRAPEQVATYADTYFDTPAATLATSDRELRVREVRTDIGVTGVLTYKGAAVDVASGSKPETETTVGDPAAMCATLLALGFVVDIALEKRCSNYRFEHDGFDMLATVVEVPELDGTFIEVETIVAAEHLGSALDAVRSVLTELGIARSDETTDTYTSAVRAARRVP